MIELSVENDEGATLRAPSPTIIKVIGCGGGGSSAVNRMIDAGVSDVEFIVLNTDVQALNVSKAQKRLAIGHQLTGGLGAGGNPSVGENAAVEDSDMIANVVKGADMVIITAGMGGGTGTGSAPVVANLAHEQGALTVAVVTTPFDFEGTVRKRYAQNGLAKLRENVDSLVIIPNQQIMRTVDKKINYRQAFRLADDILRQGVQGITEIITKPGEVNIDFADVKTVMKDQGEAILGVGEGDGESRAVDAATEAISNPLLDNRHIDGARNILVNITSAEDLAMTEVEEIISTVSASAHPDTQIFWGQVLEPSMGTKISVTVIATGFEANAQEAAIAASAEREKAANRNVVSYSDFERISSGRDFTRPLEPLTPPPVPPEERLSAVPVDSGRLYDEEEREAPEDLISDSGAQNQPAPHAQAKPQASFSEGPSLSETLRNAIRQQSKRESAASVDKNSLDYLKQPACLRNLNGLNRSIDLTED